MKNELKKMYWLSLVVAVIILTFAWVWAGEIEDLKKDLAVVQAEIRAELANLRAAQSEISRIQAIGPILQGREEKLLDKLQTLEKKSGEKK